MKTDREILSDIINLGQEITQVNDVDILLEKILTESRRFVNADAGSIYIKKDNVLRFSYAQNDSLQKKLPPGKKLIYSQFTIPVNNSSIAGFVANTGETVNIDDVYHLPEDFPYSFDEKYDEISGYRTKSILAFPLRNPRNEILGVLQLINAMDPHNTIVPFAKHDEPFIIHFANQAAIALERAQMTRALILRTLRMAEMRDPTETGAHANRVGAYSAEIYESWASAQGISSKEMERNKDVLRMAAMLHDVGKVAISDAILKKPARLDVKEFEIIKQHTFLGAKLFLDTFSGFDEAAFYIALEHHERWDGNGYPGNFDYAPGTDNAVLENMPQNASGKKGEDIHPFGRIVAVADVFDALVSRRSYKEPMCEEEVFKIMREESGKHFDPAVVAAFFAVFDIIENIRSHYPDQ